MTWVFFFAFLLKLLQSFCDSSSCCTSFLKTCFISEDVSFLCRIIDLITDWFFKICVNYLLFIPNFCVILCVNICNKWKCYWFCEWPHWRLIISIPERIKYKCDLRSEKLAWCKVWTSVSEQTLVRGDAVWKVLLAGPQEPGHENWSHGNAFKLTCAHICNTDVQFWL